jgi:hypothetical protein
VKPSLRTGFSGPSWYAQIGQGGQAWMSDTLIIVTEKVGDRAAIAVLSQNLNPDYW